MILIRMTESIPITVICQFDPSTTRAVVEIFRSHESIPTRASPHVMHDRSARISCKWIYTGKYVPRMRMQRAMYLSRTWRNHRRLHPPKMKFDAFRPVNPLATADFGTHRPYGTVRIHSRRPLGTAKFFVRHAFLRKYIKIFKILNSITLNQYYLKWTLILSFFHNI